MSSAKQIINEHYREITFAAEINYLISSEGDFGKEYIKINRSRKKNKTGTARQSFVL